MNLDDQDELEVPIVVRERMDEGVNRSRIARELRRSTWPAVGVAVGFMIMLVCGAILFRNITAATGDYRSAYEVRFTVDNANGVVAGRDEVRLAGVPIGKLTDVELEGGRAIVTARILERHGAIYRNATARLRPSTALNDVYLDIVARGSALAGEAKDGPPIAADRTHVAENIGPVLQTFNADTRARMHTLLTELGGGLDDHGADLRAAFVAAAPFVKSVARLTGELARHERQTRSLVTNVASLTSELARRERDLRTLVRGGASVLDVTARRSVALDQTLARLPGFLAQIRSAFAVTRDALPDVDTAVTRLDGVAEELRPSLAALRRLVEDATPAVRALGDPVQRLVPLAKALPPLSAKLDSTVAALSPQAAAIDHTTKSAARCGTPVNYFFQWTPSVFKLGDAYSGGPRGDANIGPDSAAVLKDPSNRVSPDSCAPGDVKGSRP